MPGRIRFFLREELATHSDPYARHLIYLLPLHVCRDLASVSLSNGRDRWQRLVPLPSNGRICSIPLITSTLQVRDDEMSAARRPARWCDDLLPSSRPAARSARTRIPDAGTLAAAVSSGRSPCPSPISRRPSRATLPGLMGVQVWPFVRPHQVGGKPLGVLTSIGYHAVLTFVANPWVALLGHWRAGSTVGGISERRASSSKLLLRVFSCIGPVSFRGVRGFSCRAQRPARMIICDRPQNSSRPCLPGKDGIAGAPGISAACLSWSPRDVCRRGRVSARERGPGSSRAPASKDVL